MPAYHFYVLVTYTIFDFVYYHRASLKIIVIRFYMREKFVNFAIIIQIFCRFSVIVKTHVLCEIRCFCVEKVSFDEILRLRPKIERASEYMEPLLTHMPKSWRKYSLYACDHFGCIKI